MLHGNRPFSCRKWGATTDLVLSPWLLTVQSSKASKAQVGAAGTAFSFVHSSLLFWLRKAQSGQKASCTVFVKGSQGFSKRRLEEIVRPRDHRVKS